MLGQQTLLKFLMHVARHSSGFTHLHLRTHLRIQGVASWWNIHFWAQGLVGKQMHTQRSGLGRDLRMLGWRITSHCGLSSMLSLLVLSFSRTSNYLLTYSMEYTTLQMQYCEINLLWSKIFIYGRVKLLVVGTYV